MAIINKDTTKKMTIDLTGTDGNAFVLLGTAKRLAKALGLDPLVVTTEMTMGDYDNLINTFDGYFGAIVDLER
ncbi:MAG: hypothetical protein H8D94_01795 [Candidatus Pelagibacter sp.]|nr:hypothetical protein [Candidatus Pelagibacter sp.]